MRKLITVLSSMALLLSLTGSAMAAPAGGGARDGHAKKGDNLPSSLSTKQTALKQRAQELVLKGQAKAVGANKVVKVAKGQFVELVQEGEDQILTLLGEFGTGDDPTHGGTRNHVNRHDPDNNATDGPLHNQIPEPDRSVDNSTIWTADFSQSYYDNLLYNKGQVPSMANWYLAQSSGRYSVDGLVSDWVQVPFNAANYGSNYCGGIVCQDTWFFIQDQADAWYQSLVDSGMTSTQIDELLATFDVWDRYDYDGDGDFNEPDGYIDHFQSVHAGEGEETGGGAQGTDAIWSHRWYNQLTCIGCGGPTVGGDVVPFGGIQLGDSGKWIGDYTIEPENGGVGVFAHEFGHDLGLPDLYDTSGNTGGAENGTGFWTMWSSGSYGSINNDGIGNYPVSATAWERYQLGWLNYGVGFTGQKDAFRLGPVEANTKQLQGLFVVLPDKAVTAELGAPAAGTQFYYSGAADDLNTTMTRSVTLPAGASLSAKVRYNIEEGYDFAYLMVDGTKVSTNLSNSSVVAEGIEGVSAGQPAWVDLTADLSAFTGSHTIGFGYFTDGGVQGADLSLPAGFAIDEIAITGQATDGAETDAGWTFGSNQADQGFHVTSGTESFDFFNAYVAEFRTYRSYDKALQLGPYNFVDPAGTQGLPNWVEHFPYQDGLLIWYWDSSFADNNVGDHPGEGLLLPVDSHPNILHWSDGSTARPRIQSYDATFGLSATDGISLHNTSADPDLTLTRSSQAAVPKFNDNLSYWRSGDPGDNGSNGRYQSEWNSVIVPHTGTTIRVVSIGAQNSFMEVFVNK
ncbi:MAG TPA: immune inhibitor A domain-containing protein [Candidatus Limnocylindria bacterium]|nr:immune inhibitor A domain-containing protein [Candidatus Limnocylindria bacterium]